MDYQDDKEDAQIANAFCKLVLEENPEIKKMFDMLSSAIDELFEANKDAMASIGTLFVKACLRHSDISSFDPNEIFKAAVDKAMELIMDFREVEHRKSRDGILRIIREMNESDDHLDSDDNDSPDGEPPDEE